MRGAWLVTIAACLVGSLARTASADRRAFAHAFQYGTEAPGETSLVAWYSEARPSWTRDVAGLELRMQIQHGITEHWDAAVYGVFTQLATGVPAADLALGLSEVRLQNRYRLADRSEWPVDVQLHLETAKQFGTSAYHVDLRAVLARDIDSFTAAVNVTGLGTLGADVDNDVELGWAAALGYELHPKLGLGVEAFGLARAGIAHVGPTLAVAPSRQLWLALSVAAAVTDDTEELVVRALLGLEL